MSAIAIASLAISQLQEDGWHGQIAKGKRRGTSNVGYIHGGGATNVTVGGTTSDARYVTYRFTGMYAGEASGDACERVLRE